MLRIDEGCRERCGHEAKRARWGLNLARSTSEVKRKVCRTFYMLISSEVHRGCYGRSKRRFDKIKVLNPLNISSRLMFNF